MTIHADCAFVLRISLLAFLCFAASVATAEDAREPAEDSLAKRPLETPEAQAAPERTSLLNLYRGMEARRVISKSKLSAPSSRYALGKVLQGDLVAHEFSILNDTPDVMRVENLQMCSGCILESHSKEISPGHQGNISFVIPTDSLGGQSLNGKITGETSSPKLPTFEVEVSLEVQEFAALEPYRVWLEGRVGSAIEATCVVIPNESYPFSIREIRARKGVWFEHSFREARRDDRKIFEIKITNTRTKPGPYQDVLFVRTDHPERPEIKIRIEGRIAE